VCVRQRGSLAASPGPPRLQPFEMAFACFEAQLVAPPRVISQRSESAPQTTAVCLRAFPQAAPSREPPTAEQARVYETHAPASRKPWSSLHSALVIQHTHRVFVQAIPLRGHPTRSRGALAGDSLAEE